jgi:decaprenyl-phosphate phosphoribosyltransferase
VTYCIWAFDTRERAGTTWPFYELSIIPMGTALLRYTLILEQGHGAAPEEIFAHDRVLQILGLIWITVFGIGVYVG